MSPLGADEPEPDDLEDLNPATRCSCSCPATSHGVAGCTGCRCPAPGLRTLSHPEDQEAFEDDADKLASRLAKSVAARRLRSRDPVIIKAREVLKEVMLGKHRRKLKTTGPAAVKKATSRTPLRAADTLEVVGAQ